MANLTIEHDGVGTIVLRQSLSNIVLSVDQIQSVIKNLEVAALEIRQAEFERKVMSDKASIQRIEKRYVRVVKIGDKWNTYLLIDHQGFCVGQQTTRQRANWLGKQLASALARLIDSSQGVD